MAKTKPIGVRFDEDLLKQVTEQGFATTHQGALIVYEETYLKKNGKVLAKPEVKVKKKAPVKASKPKKKVAKKAKTEVKGKTEPPKNLTELKAMCPAHLKGFERSEWIATERVKFGI